MRQHITTGQYNELPREHQQYLWQWWQPQEGDVFYRLSIQNVEVVTKSTAYAIKFDRFYDGVVDWEDAQPLFNIGQLIAFLDEHTKNQGWLRIQRDGEKTQWKYETKYAEFDVTGEELCDVLWGAVRMMLDKGEQ